MTAAIADLVLRVGGAVALLLAALLRWRHAPSDRATWLFIPVAIGLSAFALNNSGGLAIFTGRANALSNLLAGLTVPFLWWFCLTLFDRAYRPSLPVVATGASWFVLAFADRGFLGSWASGALTSASLLLLGFAIVVHLGYRLVGESSDDMVEWRRQARSWIVMFLALLLLVDLVADVTRGFDWRPLWFSTAQNGSIAAFALWIALRAVARPDKSARLATDGGSPLAKKVRQLMEADRIYLDPDLDFPAFASQAGFSQRQVRDHINRVLGQDHFRGFVNGYRLAEARRRLADPAHQADKLIAIAFDSGFASLASFNRLFRAETGLSPSEYRALQRNEERSESF
ncbi:AraC family transcriptional regulator [Sphingomonas xanthus]|uniref:Helix-turn-helix transcriptional regulator n=1 Tax=Sphingomonas xanthus TaxID=2594473 RepID=A0A516IQB2_9SPHN|nr:AraC family transcriptional regulator [Sphingomonas xanthus]QDP19110.1 helix-turn-helix transcriptional regulator [Sphingomonas xanthus]